MYADVLDKLSGHVGSDTRFLLQGIFNCTLPMITKDFSSYIDHRYNFFIFLRAAVKNSFEYLIAIEDEQFKIVIDCIVWAIKHELSNLYEIGLETLQVLLDVRFWIF